MTAAGLRVGYVPYSPDLSAPGDRRRLAFYMARRELPLELTQTGEDFDVVVLSARADIAHWSRVPRGRTRIVYDLIDSYLSVPTTSTKAHLRGLAKFATRELRRPVLDYRRTVEAMCRQADAVVCSTPEQREQILPLNANVHAILDAHEHDAQRVKSEFGTGPIFNLVWEGLPYTLDDFDAVAPVLRRIDADRPLALHLVTDLRFGRYLGRLLRRHTADVAWPILPRTYLYQWNTLLLDRIVTSCDLGVIPLDLQDPLARDKPENKLLLLWRMGMPTVTSATPAYRRVMAAAGSDLTCADASEWETKLRLMIDSEDARRAAAAAGLGYVEAHHDEAAILRCWDDVFRSVR